MAKHKDEKKEKKEKKKSKKDKEPDSSSRMMASQMMPPQMMMGMPPAAPGAWPMMMRMPMAVPSHAIGAARPLMGASPMGAFVGQAAQPPATGRGGMFARRSKGPPALTAPSRPLGGNAVSRSSSTSSSSSVVVAVAEAPEQTARTMQQQLVPALVPAPVQDAPAQAPHYPTDSGSVVATPLAPEPQQPLSVAPITPTGVFDVPVPLPTAKVSQTAIPPVAAVPSNAPPAPQSDDEVDAFKPKTKKKLGQIAFKIAGAKDAVVAAQERLQMEERAAAIRAKRQNMKDASTQTVRDPEQDGSIVTVWKLRRKGMESFPHFPKPEKKRKKAKAPMCVSFDDKPESEMPTAAPNVAKIQDPRKRQRVTATTVLIDDGESPSYDAFAVIEKPPAEAEPTAAVATPVSPAMKAMDDPYSLCAGDDAESAMDELPAPSAPATVSI